MMERVNHPNKSAEKTEEAAQAESTSMSHGDTLELGVTRSHAAAVNAPHMPHQAEDLFPKVEFPNYFHTKDPVKAKRIQDKVNQAMAAILTRLDVPYIDPKTGKLSHKGFFNALNAQIQAQDPGAKVYVSGGVVRSLLSYIYKKVYGQHQRHSTENTTEWVLNRIIKGPQKGENIQDSSDSESDDLTEGKLRDFHKLSALGIGSDLDILAAFSLNLAKEKKEKIIAQATNFINAAGEKMLPEVDTKSVIKRSIVAVGDVHEYSKQIERSISQGGSPLDWLAFPVSTEAGVVREGKSGTMEHFFNGEIDYSSIEQADNRAEQTVRMLRPLLEIPFLHPSKDGQKILIDELNHLLINLRQGIQPSARAKKEFEKMMRNARFEGAHNRFHNKEDSISNLVLQISQLGNRGDKNMPLVPEFSRNKKIEYSTLSQEAQDFTQYLMDFGNFKTDWTDNGILYHGTPQIEYVLTMIRNGLMPSIPERQGTAAYGAGFYTAKDRNISSSYGAGGAILELPVKPELRVLNLGVFMEHNKEVYEKLKQEADAAEVDINSYLAKKFQLDVIINEYPLIMNSEAVILPKKIEKLLKLKLSQVKGMRDFLLMTPENRRELQSFYQLGNTMGVDLKKIPNINNVEEIAKYLCDSEASVCIAAIQTLIRLKANTPEIHQQIAKRLNDQDASVRQVVIAALGLLNCTDPAIHQQIAERLEDLDVSVRQCAIEILGFLNCADHAIHQKIVKYLEDPDADMRRVAIQALAALKVTDSAIHQKIVKHLDDSDNVRLAAVSALQDLKVTDSAIHQQIAQYLSNSDAYVCRAAIDILATLEVTDSAIHQQIAACAGDKDKIEWVRQAAIKALVRIGIKDPEIRTQIAALRNDDNELVRQAAWEAIRQLKIEVTS